MLIAFDQVNTRSHFQVYKVYLGKYLCVLGVFGCVVIVGLCVF